MQILVIDDHEVILQGTVAILQTQYPEASLFTAKTAQEALSQVGETQFDVVIADLSIPETTGTLPQVATGLGLLKTLMRNFPNLNITVQSAYVKALMRIKSEIDAHYGGFTVADKALSIREFLDRVEWALEGITNTKDIKGIQLEIKSEWLEVLRLAFQEGLQDKEIASRLEISERTVRHYWTKIQDALNVYPAPGKNIRIQTELWAREEGLID